MKGRYEELYEELMQCELVEGAGEAKKHMKVSLDALTKSIDSLDPKKDSKLYNELRNAQVELTRVAIMGQLYTRPKNNARMPKGEIKIGGKY